MAPQLGRTATWEDLPIEFRLELAKLLDFESRKALRRCSKRDKFAVDDIPINMDLISISPKSSLFQRKQYFKFETDCHRRILTTKETIAAFVRIFSNKNSSVNIIEIGTSYKNRTSKKLMTLMKKLIAVLDSLDIKMNWNVKRLVWNIASDDVVFPRFLGFINSDILFSLTIGNFQNTNHMTYDIVMQTEQWKKLGEVHVGASKDLSYWLGSFHSMSVVRLKMNVVQASDLIFYIGKLLENPNPFIGSYFAFKSGKIVCDSSYMGFVASSLSPGCQRIYIRMLRLEILKFSFPANDEYSLIVFGIEHAIFGYVVHENRFAWDVTDRFLRFKFNDLFTLWPRGVVHFRVEW